MRRWMLLLLLTPVAHAQVHIVAQQFLVAYINASIPADAEAQTGRVGAHIVRRHERSGIALVSGSSAEALRAQPGVRAVAADRILAAHSIVISTPVQQPTQPADTLYNSPQGWAVRQVGGFGSPGPWDTSTGQGVRIAILDSGVDQTHPDLAPNLALNLSEIDQSALPSPCDDGSPQDQSGHGTWTASLAAAAAGAGTGELIGVAPNAMLLNIKVLERLPADGVSASTCESGQASGLLSWVIQGIDDAVANHADIISMSLGTLVDLTTSDGAGLQTIFNQATQAAADAGVIVIAAAGNDGLDLAGPRYVELPAQSRGVLAITASTNPACAENLLANASTCVPGPITRPYYSNYGIPNALAAPGGSYPASAAPALNSGWVQGACSSGLPNTIDGPPSDGVHSFGCFNLGHTAYVQAIGTSAAAPLAAGVAALILSAHPTWNAYQVLAAMQASATVTASLPTPQVTAP